MTVQVGEIFDLHRFLFFPKGGLHMPEQSVHHQENDDSDQQITYYEKHKEKHMKTIDTNNAT